MDSTVTYSAVCQGLVPDGYGEHVECSSPSTRVVLVDNEEVSACEACLDRFLDAGATEVTFGELVEIMGR